MNPLTPERAAPLLGLSGSAIRLQLGKAPRDERGRICEGPWAGAYKRGTHWKLPPQVVQREAIRRGVSDPVTEELNGLRERVTRLEDTLARLALALGGHDEAARFGRQWMEKEQRGCEKPLG